VTNRAVRQKETALEMNVGGFEMLSCLYIKAPEVAKALEC